MSKLTVTASIATGLALTLTGCSDPSNDDKAQPATPQPAPSVSTSQEDWPTVAPPEGPTIEGDGVFRVGPDIQPGTYKTAGSANGCYWARLANLSGEFGAIIANGTSTGPISVTIAPTDAGFSTSSCSQWALQP